MLGGWLRLGSKLAGITILAFGVQILQGVAGEEASSICEKASTKGKAGELVSMNSFS